MKNKQINRDKKWVILMVVAIAVGFSMPFPTNIIQPLVCGLMLIHKIHSLLNQPDCTKNVRSSQAETHSDKQ